MNNKRKRAVGLRYEQEQDKAPRLIAKGERLNAEKIIEIARTHDVPIYEDADMVNLLYTLKLQEIIPEDLYKVVAEILAFVYRIDSKYGKEKNERTLDPSATSGQAPRAREKGAGTRDD